MRTFLLIVAAISFIMMTAEAETLTMQVLSSAFWLAVFAISTKILCNRYLTKEEKEEKV